MPRPQLMDVPPDLAKYMDVFVRRSEHGYIIWRRGTGGNAELLWIKSDKKGHGRELFVGMLRQLKEDPPYHTVFGFARETNLLGLAWYDKMGFDLSRVTGVYKDGSAAVFSAPYDRLCKLHGV